MTRAASGSRRLVRAWRSLVHEQRLAAVGAGGLALSPLLPWYHETVLAPGGSTSVSVSGFSAFSFSEALILLCAAGVLTLLFRRAEGRSFHLPGGDGAAILTAGAWACLLVVWRIFERPTADVRGSAAAISGVAWGSFFALPCAGLIAYAGRRIVAARVSEPPIVDEVEVTDARPGMAAAASRPRGRGVVGADQLTIPLDPPVE